MRNPKSLRFFGAHVSTLTRDELVEQIIEAPSTDGLRLVLTMNVDHLVKLRTNRPFRLAYAHAWTVTIDSAPIIAYARLRNLGVPARVTGPDLVAFLTGALPLSRRPFFVAS